MSSQQYTKGYTPTGTYKNFGSSMDQLNSKGGFAYLTDMANMLDSSGNPMFTPDQMTEAYGKLSTAGAFNDLPGMGDNSTRSWSDNFSLDNPLGSDGKGGIFGMSKDTLSSVGDVFGIGKSLFGMSMAKDEADMMKDYYQSEMALKRENQAHTNNEIARIKKQRTKANDSYFG